MAVLIALASVIFMALTVVFRALKADREYIDLDYSLFVKPFMDARIGRARRPRKYRFHVREWEHHLFPVAPYLDGRRNAYILRRAIGLKTDHLFTKREKFMCGIKTGKPYLGTICAVSIRRRRRKLCFSGEITGSGGYIPYIGDGIPQRRILTAVGDVELGDRFHSHRQRSERRRYWSSSW